MKRKSCSLPFLAVLSLLPVAAALLTCLLEYSQTNLLRIPEWTLTKRMSRINLLGADEALLTRSLLAQGSFNAHAWYGYQEILSRQDFRARKISFRFRLPSPFSHLAVVFGANGEGFSGVRFSRHPDFAPIAFRADSEGLFQSRLSIPAAVPDGDWHLATLEFSGSEGFARLDGGAPFRFPAISAGKVGFRGGFQLASVRDVEVTGEDGSVWRPEFRWRSPFGRLFVVHFLAIALLAGAIWATIRLKGHRNQIAALGTAGFLGFGLALTLVAGAFDWYYWSSVRISAYGAPVPHDRQITFAIRATRYVEDLRHSLAGAWYAALGGDRLAYSDVRRQGYPEAALSRLGGAVRCGPERGVPCQLLSTQEVSSAMAQPKAGLRVLFVGTSQTFGCGALDFDHTFFARTVRELQRLAPQNRKIEALNLSLVAGRPAEVVEAFERVFPRYRADLVVMNMVENLPPAQVPEVYEKLLSRTDAAHTKTVLLAEAVTYEAYRKNGQRVGTRDEVVPEQYQNHPKHKLLAEIAARHGAPLLPLESYLHSPEVRDLGYLWWDHVHLTSAGHDLVARWLAPQLWEQLRPGR